MIIPIIISIASLLVLVVIHELGHFFTAKKFGVKIEEFGIGLPPRIFSKRFGETLYSINLLPIGAFVRMLGEEKAENNPRSFSTKPIWQRALIVAAGVIAFWLITALIFTFLGFTSGIPASIPDDFENGISNVSVQIIGIASDSPAANAGLIPGDIIISMKDEIEELSAVTMIKDVQEFTKGRELIVLSILRGKETLEIPISPRENPPTGEGAMGIALARTALLHYSWYEAPLKGIELTGRLTSQIVLTFVAIISNIITDKELPEGAQVSGPIGIIDMLRNSLSIGIPHFLYFIAILSLYLAIFNALPIPVVDGGHLMFMGIEAIRKKPVSEKVQQKIQTVFFVMLVSLFIWVSIQDIIRIF